MAYFGQIWGGTSQGGSPNFCGVRGYFEDMPQPRRFSSITDRIPDEQILDQLVDFLQTWKTRVPNVAVHVADGEVTLEGSVASHLDLRELQTHAEKLAGVRVVINKIHVDIASPQPQYSKL